MDNQVQGNRVFLAIFPDEKILQKVRDIKRGLKKEARNLRFVGLDQVHITLQFLGANVSDASIEYITEQIELHKGEFSKQKVTMDKLMFGFPGQRIPKFIYWDVLADDELKDFTKEIHDLIKSLELADINPHKDHAKLIHHMTIGRVKNSASKSLARSIKQILSDMNIESASFEASELVFVKSKLTNTGPQYSIIKRIDLP